MDEKKRVLMFHIALDLRNRAHACCGARASSIFLVAKAEMYLAARRLTWLTWVAWYIRSHMFTDDRQLLSRLLLLLLSQKLKF